MSQVSYDFEAGPLGPRLAVVVEKPVGEGDQEAKRQEDQKVRQSVVRRRDAVVDAARTLEDLSTDGVRRFVTQRWPGKRALEEADVESFASDARSQRIEDVVDALDSRVRQGVLGWGSKHVKVEMPRGWLRQSLRAMSADELSSVRQRLIDRGWDDKAILKHTKTFHAIMKIDQKGDESASM